MKNIFNKKNLFLYGTVAVLLILSIIIVRSTITADSDAQYNNKITIKTAKITKIETGTDFSVADNLQENDEGEIQSYYPSGDSSEDNRLVKSNDSISYFFNYSIGGKNDDATYYSRIVNITVELSPEEAKYVTFEPNKAPGETSKTYSIDNTSSNTMYGKEIKLYVVNAPNGTAISPKFSFKESTDTNAPVILGKNDNGDYDYNYSNGSYSGTNISTVANFLPTIVSAREQAANIQYTIVGNPDGQKAVYNSQLGRFFTGVLSAYVPTEKGVYISEDSLSLNLPVSTTTTGSGTVTIENNWVRLYNTELTDTIEPIVVAEPYSISDGATANNQTRYPGTVSYSGNNMTVTGLKVPAVGPGVAANSTTIPASKKIIGTYAISFFSPRTSADGKNPVNVTLNVGTANITFTNEYYEDTDYKLKSGFYDESGDSRLTKHVDESGKIEELNSSTSKGSTITYKTEFKFKKTGSDSGLKEVLTVDPLAFRVIPFTDRKDVSIKLSCKGNDCEGISEDDFEFKYITGDFNYKNTDGTTNYTFGDVDSRVSAENRDYATSQCANLAAASDYSREQIMNLYGGPCIKDKEGVESFDKINDSRDEQTDVEKPITKVIIQTKEGVILPDDTTVTILVKLRVRNVADITRSYQSNVVLSTSDYDSELYYFAPEINETPGAVANILNPDNYTKSYFEGSTVRLTSTQPYADTIRVVNLTARQDLVVTNKKSDGQMKTSFETGDNDVIQYKLSTHIQDLAEQAGADDTWYIKMVKIDVNLPNTLDYIQDDSLGTPGVFHNNDGSTTLSYILPWTKANFKIPDILFNTKLSDKLTGTRVPITVTASLNPININGEFDASVIDALRTSFVIYGTESRIVLLSQTNDNPTTVDKNATFTYLLHAKNNTGAEVNNYVIEDILPYNKDERGSAFDGNYEVKVEIPSSQPTAKLYCSKNDSKSIKKEVTNTEDGFEECDATEDFVSATAIRITGIKLGNTDATKVMEPIKVTLKTNGSKYDNKFVNDFFGAHDELPERTSNKITYRVINRTISGRVFIDKNENGIRDENEQMKADLPVTLYKVENGKLTEAASTIKTNKDGEYKFDKLDAGLYRVRIEYSNDDYDLALRYGSENQATDSDAYKIKDGLAEISGKWEPNTIEGIDLTVFTKSKAEDMDMGLIPRQTFGFVMKKYITQVDLTYNSALDVRKYNNQSTVSIGVQNPLNASAKVYYGMEITNNSTTPGIIEKVHENIPNGLIFDSTDPYNSQWAVVNNELQSTAFESDIVEPGESKYLRIALQMPNRETGDTFINEVEADVVPYIPKELAKEAEFTADNYNAGDSVEYAGESWHVIRAEAGEEGEQILTLLADAGSVSSTMSNISGNLYRWSTSPINTYINSYESNGWLSTNSINTPILYDQVVCDDASSFEGDSYGGTMLSAGKCTSNSYVTTKVRLLTFEDYEYILSQNLSDISWLYQGGDYWLMNAVNSDIIHNVYGVQTNPEVNKYGTYVSTSSTSVIPHASATGKKAVRPVITVSSKNLIGN